MGLFDNSDLREAHAHVRRISNVEAPEEGEIAAEERRVENEARSRRQRQLTKASSSGARFLRNFVKAHYRCLLYSWGEKRDSFAVDSRRFARGKERWIAPLGIRIALCLWSEIPFQIGHDQKELRRKCPRHHGNRGCKRRPLARNPSEALCRWRAVIFLLIGSIVHGVIYCRHRSEGVVLPFMIHRRKVQRSSGQVWSRAMNIWAKETDGEAPDVAVKGIFWGFWFLCRLVNTDSPKQCRFNNYVIVPTTVPKLDMPVFAWFKFFLCSV